MEMIVTYLERHSAAVALVALVVGAAGSAACASGGDAETRTKGPGPGTDSGLDSGAAGGAVGGRGGTGGSGGGSAGLGGATGGSAGISGQAGGGFAGEGGSSGVDAGDAAFDGPIDGGGDADSGIPCENVAEVCNGLDDNCNGAIDEGDPGGGLDCEVPAANGVCKDGLTTCRNGVVECTAVNSPSSELCDGLDNNCNGATDEGDPEAGDACNTGLEGVCAQGTTACVAGVVECEQNLQPQPETCNGLDDNCDGTPDEGFGGGDPCTVPGWPVGSPCADGLTNCLGGQEGCTQVNFQSSEVCDDVDNDCDGTIDNPSLLNGQSCNTGLDGICAAGATSCSGGTETCVPAEQPGAKTETCNTLDDDCNGTVDDVPNIALECGAKNPLAQNVVNWQCTTGFCQVTACSGAFADCNGAPGDGCEVDKNQSANNCGGCGNVCNGTNGTPQCSGGSCGILCNSGWGNCDGDAGNGCETNTNTDVSNCGVCGTVCLNPGGSTACSGGNCVPVCSGTSKDCDGNLVNGCETDTSTDVANCGTCGLQCTNLHGSTSCTGGACNPSCSSGFDDCDGNLVNGCETDVNNDVAHCGSCSKVCQNPNGSTSCVGGVCTPSCSGGSADCDGNPDNGCETDISSSIGNCGGCGVQCSNGCGTTSCSFGSCSPSCGANCASCDGDPVNGCETDLSNDPTNCGACGTACTNAHGATQCTASVCSPTCNGTWRDCDGNPNNGCESDVDSDVNHCSACGSQCTNAHGSTACVSGTCTPSCVPPWDDCDGDPDNGCETNTDSDLNHCGQCGLQCTNPGGSVNCVGGVCQPGCDPGRGDCDGNSANGCETDTTTTSNCGGCGVACTNAHGTAQCISQICVPTCTPGWGDCDGNPNNGCETSLNTTVNCGACGRGCSGANVATQSCTNGLCTSSCDPGWGNCVMPAAPGGDDGCETSTDTSTNNCGGCGNQCTNSHGSTQCVGGSCSPSCNTGWGSCDGDPDNGCETSLTTTSDCGSCGNTCTNQHGTTSCNASGSCVPSCSSPWAVCGGDPDLGCLVDTDNDTNNCGGCGIDCDTPLPQNSTAASCDGGGSCQVDSCVGGYFDVNNSYGDGCECQQDSYSGANCSAASNAPGTVAIGASSQVNGNLTPTGDDDWFVVTFTQAASCGWGPTITATGSVQIEVYTSCAGGSAGTPFHCGPPGPPTPTSFSDDPGLTSWSFDWRAACGTRQPIDPARSPFISWPDTYYVHVTATASGTCLDYTLTFQG